MYKNQRNTEKMRYYYVLYALWHNKMVAPLSVCTKEEQCTVIRFLCSEGVPGTEGFQLNMGAVLYHGEVYTNK
jgi:hypothetical protein